MSHIKRLEKIGATPGKLALIGVLTLVLVMVIAKQFPKSASESVRTAETVAQPTPTEEAPATSLTAKKTKVKSELSAWPEIALSTILTNDPFALPGWATQPETPTVTDTLEKPEELAQLQEQGTSIVVIGQGTRSATIGEQKLYVGDILEGYRITDITTQGIFLDKLDPQ